jgi:hypothetical protein
MLTYSERGWARSMVVRWPFSPPYFSTRHDKTWRARIDFEREAARERNAWSQNRESPLHFPVPRDSLNGEPNYPLPDLVCLALVLLTLPLFSQEMAGSRQKTYSGIRIAPGDVP